MSKKNVTVDNGGTWDAYVNKPADEVIPEIYQRANKYSKDARTWYWNSIRGMRWRSWGIRALSFALLVCGVVLPLIAAIQGNNMATLTCTQLGVVAIAVAGLMQAADRIFGWSSGWLRYMTTVTDMEAATRQFELDWAGHFLAKPGPPSADDKIVVFQLAQRLHLEISELQSDETSKWSAEFNNGLAVLNDLIRSQRESAEKAVEAMEKSMEFGSIEVKLVHESTIQTVRFFFNDDHEEEFTGTSWSKFKVEPGQHRIKLATQSAPPKIVQQIVEVPPGGVARATISVPN